MAFVVFAGQSNALGFGMTRDSLPSGYQTADPLTLIWNPASGAFETMVAGVNTGTPVNPGAWGPEVGFAHDFRAEHPDEVLLIVKSVKGSTGLAADPERLDWSPQSHGELFDLTADRVAAARAAAGEPAVDAVFIVQGEQDGAEAQTAAAYGQNLTAWLDAIRARWIGDVDGHVGLAQICASNAGFGEVSAAQAQAGADDAFTGSICTDGLPMQSDGLHYAAEGFLSIGDGFYSLFDDWNAPPLSQVEAHQRAFYF